MTDAERELLRKQSQVIHGHGRFDLAGLLAQSATYCADNNIKTDHYGSGEFIESFEADIASRLGFEAARFMPSGKVAQNVALRVWAERASNHHIGMHPTSHLELHEDRGYSHLFGLRATLVGPAQQPLLAEHLAAVPEPLAALLVELPIREAGGQLPSWAELESLKQATAARGAKFHLDGARLWEAAAGYGRPLADVCAGFDSAYVSFYKGIGALPGSMLLGPRDFIDEAKVWQRRAGATLYSLTANAASAAMQIDDRLAKMPAYLEKARELGRALAEVDGVAVLPDPPQVNMMHVFLEVEAERAKAARDHIARESGLWLFGHARPADRPDHCRFELYVGDAALAVDTAKATEAFSALVATARAEPVG